MTKEEGIQILLNSYIVDLWEKDSSISKSHSDPSSLGMEEIINALKAIEPNYNFDKGCPSCIKEMLNKAVKTKNEHKLHFHKFPKQ